jgi:hypothetical protein
MNPFAAPGLPGAHADIFSARPRGAVVRPRKVEAPPPEEAEAYGPEPGPAEAEEKKEEALLSDVAFAKAVAGFGETVVVSATVSLPKSIAHMTRVVFTLCAPGQDGKPEAQGQAEGHAKDGKVTAKMVLPQADPKSDAREREFTLRAKHKTGKEAEGGKLKVKADAPADLEIEIGDAAAAKKEGHGFRLTGEPGKVQKTLFPKDGKEKDGKLLLKFEKLDPTLQYTLEELDSQGKMLGAIFSGKKFGVWSP